MKYNQAKFSLCIVIMPIKTTAKDLTGGALFDVWNVWVISFKEVIHTSVQSFFSHVYIFIFVLVFKS